MRDRFPWIVAAIYAAVFSLLGAWRYAVHRNFVDFGIFSQTVASAFGCFCNQIEGSHWAFHFSPILYVAGAIVAVWHSPFALIAIQAIACALVIPPVYALIVLRSDRRVAMLGAVVAALYPALAGLTFGDFHENGFAPAAVAWTLWAFEAEALVAAAVFAVMTLSIKEDQAVFLGVVAAVNAWRYRGSARGRLSIAMLVTCAAVILAFFFLIQPHATANDAWSPTRFYAWTLADLHALPAQLVVRLGFLVLAFLPLLFLPFRSPMMWFALAPLAEVLLSRMSTTYTLGTHYAGAWLGYVLVAFAFSVGDARPQRVRRLLWWCIALCIVEFAVANPMHPGMNLRPVQARDRALDAFLAAIPDTARLATQEEAYTHLALTHPLAGLLPEDPARVADACLALVDRDYPQSVILIEYGDAFERLLRRGVYRPVRTEGAIGLYSRCAQPARPYVR